MEPKKGLMVRFFMGSSSLAAMIVDVIDLQNSIVNLCVWNVNGSIFQRHEVTQGTNLEQWDYEV